MSIRTVRRVELPSGGWWEIETRPRWRHVREWANSADGLAGLSGADLSQHALISLTTAWSFQDEISLETLAHRDAEDVLAAMEILKREVAPLWDSDSPRELAEALFAGLVRGRVPGEFADVHLMALTGWSWDTLMKTPADVVERMAIYLAVKEARESGQTLDYPEEHNEP